MNKLITCVIQCIPPLIVCNNKNNIVYSNYGGRGITVCKKWRNTPKEFVKWAKPKWREGLQIDRKDNDGNYEPGNCRFVTAYVNANNRRVIRSNNISGYCGVCFNKHDEKYHSYITDKFKGSNFLGSFEIKEEAVQARNNFIVKYNLPHAVQEIQQ